MELTGEIGIARRRENEVGHSRGGKRGGVGRKGGRKASAKIPKLTFQFLSCHPIILSWKELTPGNVLRATSK